jgi:hypothetical protein
MTRECGTPVVATDKDSPVPFVSPRADGLIAIGGLGGTGLCMIYGAARRRRLAFKERKA